MSEPVEPEVSDTAEAGLSYDARPMAPIRRRLRAASRRPGAAALGAFALGALAVGALAIGSLVVGNLIVNRARIRNLRIDRLVVGHVEGFD